MGQKLLFSLEFEFFPENKLPRRKQRSILRKNLLFVSRDGEFSPIRSRIRLRLFGINSTKDFFFASLEKIESH